MQSLISVDYSNAIAVIGMSGRFPNAGSIDELWENLREGVVSISFFEDEELLASGVSKKALESPNVVKARGAIEGIEFFDAGFFGLTPREARLMDPQHRVFMECAWEALESAGYNPDVDDGLTGVFAGASANTYFFSNLLSNRDFMASVGSFQASILSSPDFLATRASYRFNLRGPSLTIQTACSTSLVAVHLACQSLLNGESDIALAGGVSITVPPNLPYFYEEGGILSPDGHCRPFDAEANGTVPGNGAAVVVLKRMKDALADRDRICAVIRGSAINNDGGTKAGYTAPSVDGQVRAIADALGIAEVSPETVTFIETHGTGTALGDVIEIDALKQVFGTATKKRNLCALGSVKSNLGHLDAAAGITGFVKTTLALQNRMIPPSPQFNAPNPQVDLEDSPFYINNQLKQWPSDGAPLRAGVSSFGIGGTNAHVILEEAPKAAESSQSRSRQLLVLSARSHSALDRIAANLSEHLKRHAELKLADVAYTLHVGRKAFDYRRALVCQSAEEAIESLDTLNTGSVPDGLRSLGERDVVFMFPGQGSQYVNMGRDLYSEELYFREQVDMACELLRAYMGCDLREYLYPPDDKIDESSYKLQQTAVTQPALFVVEYALAKLWMRWVGRPKAMLGHSIGEYVAACIAGVFSLEDALSVVAARGRLIQSLQPGAMLAVSLPEQEISEFLNQRLWLAVSNGPSQCVVSGDKNAIDALQHELNSKGVSCSRLHASHAFHSAMMDPVLDEFERCVKKVKITPAELPYLSNLTGTWINPSEVLDPGYWSRHLRQSVRFNENLQETLKNPKNLFLEVGPGHTLSSLIKQHPGRAPEHIAITSLSHPRENGSDVCSMLKSLGEFWIAGGQIDLKGFYADETRNRVLLPTYPFERERYWVEPRTDQESSTSAPAPAIPTLKNSFYAPVWRHSPLRPAKASVSAGDADVWLVIADEFGTGSKIADRLSERGLTVILGEAGGEWSSERNGAYTLDPANPEHISDLIREVCKQGFTPSHIVYCWALTADDEVDSGVLGLNNSPAENAFYGLISMVQAIGQQQLTNQVQLDVISSGIHSVTGDERLHPQSAVILGACRVIPQEYSNISCSSIDVATSRPESLDKSGVIDRLVEEASRESKDSIIAYRGLYRWVQSFEPVQLGEPQEDSILLRRNGTYLITDGLSHTGLILSEEMVRKVSARLVLITPDEFPDRQDWTSLLRSRPESDDVCRQIRRLQQLEENGGEVLVLTADTADREWMGRAVASAVDRFGLINGIIHLTSLPSAGLIQLKARDSIAATLRVKVESTLALHYATRDMELDFFALFSSSGSITGGLGQMDLCAGNNFLDAFAHYRALNQPGLTVSINWDPFKWEDWEIAQSAASPALTAQLKETYAVFGLTERRTIDAFEYVISNGLSQVVVSTRDLRRVIEEARSIDLGSLMRQLSKTGPGGAKHPRPNLSTPFAAPRNETESVIAGIWEEIFGIEQLGIHDKFFDLGGSSLLAIQLINQLRNAFGMDVSVNIVFERPTISDMAEALGGSHLAKEEDEQVERIFEEIKDLSTDELEALLGDDLILDQGEDASA